MGVALTGPGAPSPSVIKPLPASWFHAVIEMKPNQVIITIDSDQPRVFNWNATPPPNAILKLGIVGANGVPSSIRVDNVALD